MKRDPSVSLVENAQEYLSYVQQLQSRYLRQQGEVFTVSMKGLYVGFK